MCGSLVRGCCKVKISSALALPCTFPAPINWACLYILISGRAHSSPPHHHHPVALFSLPEAGLLVACTCAECVDPDGLLKFPQMRAYSIASV